MLNVGEQLVSSYLRYIRKCDFIQTNLYTVEAHGEIDVVGINLKEKQVYICEVAIHLTTGLQDYRTTGLQDYRTTGLQDSSTSRTNGPTTYRNSPINSQETLSTQTSTCRSTADTSFFGAQLLRTAKAKRRTTSSGNWTASMKNWAALSSSSTAICTAVTSPGWSANGWWGIASRPS